MERGKNGFALFCLSRREEKKKEKRSVKTKGEREKEKKGEAMNAFISAKGGGAGS